MSSLVAQRLAAQALTRPAASVPEVVQRLGAMQGQDFGQVQWALGVRCPSATARDVAAAFAEGRIARTWAMRGTLHVVPAEDVGWLAHFCAKRNLARAARRLRELHIAREDLIVARKVVERVLAGRRSSRDELFVQLEAAGQAVQNQRGVHLLWHLAQEGVVCFAGDELVLLEGWVPRPRRLAGDEALGELAARYFRGHGPASLEDFAFWAGLSKGEARRAREIAGPQEPPQTAGSPAALLLPGFDEYFLGYADRSFCLAPADFARVVPGGNGVFLPMVVVRGQVRGTWRRRVATNKVTVTVAPFASFTSGEARAIEAAALAFGTFHGKPLQVVFDGGEPG